MTLIAALQSSTARWPTKTAVACGQQSYSYAEFDRLTANIASNLTSAGLEPGDRVAIHILNSLELALAYIGCLKAGAILVPINTGLKGHEIDYILRHSGSAAYIGQPDLYRNVAPSCPALTELYMRFLTAGPETTSFQHLLADPRQPTQTLHLDSGHPAAILYTSGTTSHPKGVVHTHATLIQTAHVMRDMKLTGQETVLIMSSMAHLIAFGLLFLPSLLTGATVVITRPFDSPAALDAFACWRCTYTVALPVQLQMLLDEQLRNPRDVSSARHFFGGGDSVTPALQRSFERCFAPIAEAYGATEIAPSFWNRPANIRVGSIGHPAPEVSARLISAAGQDVEPGQAGELLLRGPHLMAGYWRDPDSTDAAFQNGWFRTGDVARQDSDGFYWFAGRTKEIIVRGGSNVSPQEVEAALVEHPAVAEAAVVGEPDPIWGEKVVAHVVTAQGRTVTGHELIEFARQRLADYKLPEIVIFRSALPKGPTGKVRRRELREQHAAPELSSR